MKKYRIFYISFQSFGKIACILLLFLALMILSGLISCTNLQTQKNNAVASHPRLKWSSNTGSRITTSPAFDEGTIFFANDAGYVYAFNSIDGSIKWTYRTSTFGTPSTPVVGKHAIFFGNNDEHLYAIDKETGNELWQYKTYSQKSSTPLYHQGKVFISRFDFRRYVEPKETAFVMAVNAQTGQEVWKYYSGVIGDPQIYNEKLYCGYLSMLCPETGELIQHVHLLDYLDHVKFGPIITEDRLYIAEHDKIISFDPVNEKILWTFSTHDSITAPPLLDEKNLYFITENGSLYNLDVSSGKEIWKVDLQDRFIDGISVMPVASKDAIFVSSNSGTLHAFDKKDGTKKWSFIASTEGIQSTPLVVNDYIYFADLEGMIYALEISSQ